MNNSCGCCGLDCPQIEALEAELAKFREVVKELGDVERSCIDERLVKAKAELAKAERYYELEVTAHRATQAERDQYRKDLAERTMTLSVERDSALAARDEAVRVVKQMGECLDARDSEVAAMTAQCGEMRKALEKTRIADKSRSGSSDRKGFKGVHFDKTRTSPWYAAIAIPGQGKQKYLGRYATVEEAARVYDAAAVELFGDKARLNFPVTSLPPAALKPKSVREQIIASGEDPEKYRSEMGNPPAAQEGE